MQHAPDLLSRVLACAMFLLMFGMAFWIPSEILRKAGFSRWLAILIPPTGFLGLAVLAFLDWPVEMELAWLRLKNGADPRKLIGLVENHAVLLEKRGDWSQAAEVYKELARNAPSEEQAGYYQNCLNRLKELAGSELAS
jgi:hypothetical protein